MEVIIMKKMYEVYGLTEEQFKYCEAIDDTSVYKDFKGNYKCVYKIFTRKEYLKARLEALYYNIFKGYKYRFEFVKKISY